MKTKTIVGTMVVSKYWFWWTKGVSQHAKALISPFSLLEVERVFPDSENPQTALVNFRQISGAYEAADFGRPGRFALFMCRGFGAMRRLREKLWEGLERIRKMALP